MPVGNFPTGIRALDARAEFPQRHRDSASRCDVSITSPVVPVENFSSGIVALQRLWQFVSMQKSKLVVKPTGQVAPLFGNARHFVLSPGTHALPDLA
jgi:hypothetical protein